MPTREWRRRHPVPRTPHSALTAKAGFTLLELILVLVVLGIGSAIAAARLGGMRGTVGVDLAAQRVVDQARRCQHLATTNGHQVRLRLELETGVMSVAALGEAREHTPGDGQDAQVALTTGADALTFAFARSDGVSAAGDGRTIDVLFAPDSRCEPAGVLTIASKNKSASVRLFAGARLPELVTTITVAP